MVFPMLHGATPFTVESVAVRISITARQKWRPAKWPVIGDLTGTNATAWVNDGY